MKKIENLTQEQESMFPVYVERFIKQGLDTTTNKSKAEAAVALAYEKAGLKPPSKYIWFGSPLGQALGYAIFANVLNDSSSLKSAWDSVRGSVRDSVWDSVRDSVREGVWDWYKDVYEGSHFSHKPAFYAYLNEQLGVDTSMFDGLKAISEECGWVYFGRNIALMSPKPSECYTIVNSRGNHVLHCETGPAIRYQDGFEIWAYEGVRLSNPRYHIPVKDWKPEWILDETNADVRSALLTVLRTCERNPN